MKIKTFYAKTMAEAMQEIKVSLGGDALLLSTREIPSRSGVGGSTSGFEVVAACDEITAVEPEAHSLQAGVDVSDEGLQHKLRWGSANGAKRFTPTYTPASLRRLPVPRTQSSAASKGATSRRRSKPDPAAPPQADAGLPFADSTSLAIYRNFISNGIEEWLSRKLVIEGRELLNPKQRRARTAMMNAINHVAQGLIPPQSAGDGIPSRQVVVFVGPTGVGKTTSIAKLAAHLTLHHRKKVVLMSLDRYRIGAIEQLKTYAGLMGIPFRFVHEIPELPRAIRENEQRDFILIDTTGRSPRDMGGMKDLAEYLRNADRIERHLVLSATTKATDLHEIIDGFDMCSPDRLLVTKLDETSTAGPILNELVRTRKPMSYYSDGQRVPEDLHVAPTEQLIEFLLDRN